MKIEKDFIYREAKKWDGALRRAESKLADIKKHCAQYGIPFPLDNEQKQLNLFDWKEAK